VRAATRLGVKCVTASGGVVCNSALRRELASACGSADLKLRLAEKRYSTDNAVMIGILAERKFLSGKAHSSLDAEIEPSWVLA
jgi:N6-L-threonylcarbamoyladenine synthase